MSLLHIWQVIMNLCSVDQFSTLLWLWLCPDFNFNWMLIACEFWSMISWFTDYIWFYHLILNAATPNCVAKLLLCYMKWLHCLFVEIECTAFYFHSLILLLLCCFSLPMLTMDLCRAAGSRHHANKPSLLNWLAAVLLICKLLIAATLLISIFLVAHDGHEPGCAGITFNLNCIRIRRSPSNIPDKAETF